MGAADKTIGIITIQGNNYGATLQAVALNRKLNSLGFYAENLDYNDENRVKGSMTVKKRLKHFVWSTFEQLIIGKSKQKKFEDFRRKYLKISKNSWITKEQLRNNVPLYDVYLSGSDQIWNPDVIIDDYNYLLQFADDKAKKISYASSFGKGDINDSVKETYRELLNRYDSISVREASGQKIVKELTGRDAEVVLDPTLLLDINEWKELVSIEQEKNSYILCYYMPGDKLVCDAIKKISDELSKTTGFKVVNLGLKGYYKLKKNMDCRVDAGPEEFLSLFINAEYVVTNSFHGTVFATNFNKPVYVPINDVLQKGVARHTRMIDYLEMIGLNESMVSVGAAEDINISNIKFNYNKVNEIIEKKRRESIEYIINAINI